MDARKSVEKFLESKPDPVRTHDWIDLATISELQEFLRFGPQLGREYGQTVLQIRLSEATRKPHLILWLTFVFTVIAAVASVIGYWSQIVAAAQALLSLLSSHGRP